MNQPEYIVFMDIFINPVRRLATKKIDKLFLLIDSNNAGQAGEVGLGGTIRVSIIW